MQILTSHPFKETTKEALMLYLEHLAGRLLAMKSHLPHMSGDEYVLLERQLADAEALLANVAKLLPEIPSTAELVATHRIQPN